MKKIIPAFLFAMLLFSFSVKPKKVILFGDSITQAGVNPGGYIRLMDSLAAKEGQGSNFEFVGKGIGGNKVYDLYLRLEKDVLDLQPDVVVIYIGVNDVWHKQSFGTGTDPDKFVQFYQAIIDKLRAKNIKVILATPAVIGEKTDFSNQQDGDLNKYSSLIRKLASDNKLTLVDLRKEFLAYNASHNPDNKDRGILTTDGVHLNAAGNLLVAQKFWAVIP